jgi:hypothetical protein
MPILIMSSQFSVLDVSAQFMMDVAKAVASSPHPLSKEDLLRSFKKSRVYVLNALSQCIQLSLVNLRESLYVSSEKCRDILKRSERSQLYLSLREALQRYPPFLLYIDFISKRYSSEESATMTRGIFRIESAEDTVEKSFRTWGIFAQLIREDEEHGLSIPEAEKGLPTEYVASLMKALRASLQASIFLIETMSPQAYAYLTEKSIGIEDLSDALINYEIDPKTSANKACQTFEHFLFKLGGDVGASVSTCNGVIEYADAIRGQNEILKNQLHLCHGIGGLRNMAHHDPDKETGKPWIFTPQGAIISSLIIPTMIRSLYLYWKEKKQEF